MTSPSFVSLCTIVSGWLFSGRGVVTRIIVAAGSGATKHFSSYHRLFSTASWSLDAMGLAVFTMLEPFLGEVVMLGLDDTLARKRGLRMFGTGMHHDPLSSTRSLAFVRWGHSWVVLGIIVDFPFRPGHWIFLPLLFRLYVNRQTAAKHGGHYRTRPELGIEMLRILCSARENRRFHVVADSAYGGQNVLARLPGNCDLTSRLLLAARLYDAAPERLPGTNGRPRKRGQRLSSPADMLQGRCRRISLSIYGRSYRSRVVDKVARVFAVPDRPLRIVASDALEGGRGQEAFYSTCYESSAEQVIRWYAMRWSVEVTFRDSKQCLGFEEPQGWSRKAVERTAPLAMLLHTLVVLWFAKEGHRLWRPPALRWYPGKAYPSFSDMLRTLRRASVRQHVVIRRFKTGHASAPKTGHHVGGIERKNPLVRTCWQVV